MRYGNDFGMDWNRPGYEGWENRGRMQSMGNRGYSSDFYGGANPGGRFRGRGGEYESYSRRDFRTNQGDFSDQFGGGPDYGYEPTGRNFGRDRWQGTTRGSFANRGETREFGAGNRGDRFGRQANYGPGYGERWETTTPYDISYRNFRR